MQPTERTRVRRAPKRGKYDRDTIYSILDKEIICHVGFVHDGVPVVIPTLYGREADVLFLHGSTASRMMKTLSEGVPVSISIARVNALVLARSAFHHSANYESVVVFGTATLVEIKEEKLHALKVVSDHILKGRWEECRAPSDKELKGTAVLAVKIEDASAKIREGGPIDDKADYELPIWAGELPIERMYGDPITDPNGTLSLNPGASVLNTQTKQGRQL